MRKWFFGAIAIGVLQSYALPTIAWAQTWHLPVRAGWSRAGINGGNQLGSDYVNGFVGAVGAALRLNADVSVEFDVAYSQKGGKGTITNEVANSPSNPPQTGTFFIEGETSLDYLEFWAMVAAHLEVSDKSQLKDYLGVSLGNLLNATVEGTANGQPIDLDIKDGLKSVDWAGLVGAGFTYSLESVTVFIDVMGEMVLSISMTLFSIRISRRERSTRWWVWRYLSPAD
jgi:hypothetical protein